MAPLLLRMWVGGANVWCGDVVSPLSLLKNPMILIAIVGLGFVFGMPYLLENSTTSAFRPPLHHKRDWLTCWVISGPRNESRIRRTAEEEHIERWD